MGKGELHYSLRKLGIGNEEVMRKEGEERGGIS
jgi:hypothetical protein